MGRPLPLLACAFTLASAGAARAEQLLIDTVPVVAGSGYSGCDRGFATLVQATDRVLITRIEAHLNADAATQVRILIFASGGGQLFATDPIAIPAGPQTVVSPPLEFQTTPGTSYEILAVVQGCATWSYDSVVETGVGLTTGASLGLYLGFAAPARDFDVSGDNVPFRIFGVADPEDLDGDGHVNADDVCPLVPDAAQADADADGLGDACDDTDGNDLDGDAIQNPDDNCPLVANPDQADVDEDDAGDACDTHDAGDVDGDGVANGDDNCPLADNPAQDDLDADELGDACDDRDDRDLDADGVANDSDNCPLASNPAQADDDADGLGDACDGESDVGGDGGCAITGESRGGLALVALALVLALRRRRRYVV